MGINCKRRPVINGRNLKVEKRRFPSMKRLNTFLFGGRRSLILAERFHLPISSITLRLPIGFKVGTRQLRDFFQNDRFDIFPSILDSSFVPLDLISIYVMNTNDVQHPIVSTAKTLIIFGFGTDVDKRTAIRNCSNQQVVVRSIWFTITVEQMFGNVQYCLENRSIETCYSYSINDEKTAKELFRLIKTRIDNTKRTKRWHSIIMFPKTKKFLSDVFLLKQRIVEDWKCFTFQPKICKMKNRWNIWAIRNGFSRYEPFEFRMRKRLVYLLCLLFCGFDFWNII